MLNYFSKIRCVHCENIINISVNDLSNKYNQCIFAYCPNCRKYNINQMFKDFILSIKQTTEEITEEEFYNDKSTNKS